MKESFNTTTSSNYNYDSNVQIQGKIVLKLSFNKATSNLNVDVVRCENLAAASNKKETTNP